MLLEIVLSGVVSMGLISISQMAKIHNISRQTLIYYDQMGIFKPAYIDEKGYRFYSEIQIPFLREICFLKSIGVKLKETEEYFDEREPKKVVSLLNRKKTFFIDLLTKACSVNAAGLLRWGAAHLTWLASKCLAESDCV